MSNDRQQETAYQFVEGEELVPHPLRGMVPVYDGHPPDTVFPMTTCPHCERMMPTMYDLWRIHQNKARLVELRNEHEYGTDEWKAYNEGIHELNDRGGRIMWALPSNVASWASTEVIKYDGF